MITRCCLIMQIQTLLFCQRRHHCLCVLQLNNVQAFVNVLDSRFHCESSAVAIVYTSVLESWVSYSCHQDFAHHSDVLVLGSDTLSPRYHRCADVVLEYLKLLCNDDLASIDQFVVLVQQLWNRLFENVCTTDHFANFAGSQQDGSQITIFVLAATSPPPLLLRTRISGTCSSGGGAGGGSVGFSIGAVAVGIPSSRLGSRIGPGIPESISTSKFHFVPRASIVSRRLHCSPGGFLRTDLRLSKPCFVPTRCSSDDASRPHQQPLIHLFVSLAARTS